MEAKYLHEFYTFDNVYDAATWLEHAVEEFIDSPEWELVEARTCWINHQWTSGYTAVKRQGELEV